MRINDRISELEALIDAEIAFRRRLEACSALGQNPLLEELKLFDRWACGYVSAMLAIAESHPDLEV